MDSKMLQEYSIELEKINSVFGILDFNRIVELQEEMFSQNNISPLMNNHYSDNYYDFEIYKNNKIINSIFIIATPSPFYVLRIKSPKKSVDLVIPPNYANRNVILENIKSITTNIFVKYGYSTFPIILPKKLLAVHSGLAQYGNNGLIYIKGMGSYCRLTAFASDYKNNNNPWIKPSMLKSCKGCGKCVKNCPSKALTHGTPWVNINKCITEYNEKEGVFPNWFHNEWHNCVIGCIKCQEICPYNNDKKYVKIIEIEYQEIMEIVNSKKFNDLSEKNKSILKSLNIDQYYSQLRRNIKLFLL